MKKQLIAALLCAVTPLVYATTDSLDEVVVTATRVDQQLAQTLSHTTVISQKDIQNSLASDVPSLLKNLAGVEIYQSGGVGKQSSLFLRGSNSSHTLVLLDGVRINSATSGMTAIDQLMIDQIERIEVVRGNVSSLYGSDAIGGVVQIFTKRGKGTPAINGSAGAGSYHTRSASAGFGGGTSTTSFNVQVSRYMMGGFSAINQSTVPAVNPDKDGYANTSVSANVRHSFQDAHSFSASVFDSNATNQADNSFGLTADVNSSKPHLRKTSVISENRFSDRWSSKLQISRGVDDIRNYLNGVPDISLGAQFKTTSDLISWQNILQDGDNNQLLVGLEKLKQHVASSTSYTRSDRRDDSIFTGYTVDFGAQQLQLNYRRDRYSDFGVANTWLFGYGFDVADAWRVTASMATAFKAPTLNDLFYPLIDYGFGYSYSGNPNLKPERSRDREFGVHYLKDVQRLDMVYFDNRIRDLIVNNNLAAGSMINLDEARSDGVEVNYNGQFGDTSLTMAATRQNPRDATTGQPLLRRAKFFSNLGIMQHVGVMRMGVEWKHSSERADVDINTFSRTQLPAYDVLNFSAIYALDKQFGLSLRVDNLLNKDYMLAHGYNTAGRSIFLGLSYH